MRGTLYVGLRCFTTAELQKSHGILPERKLLIAQVDSITKNGVINRLRDSPRGTP